MSSLNSSSATPVTSPKGGSSYRRPYPTGARKDAYPEDTTYRDTGCHSHPACLSCPEPACLQDRFRGILANNHRLQNRALTRLRLAGRTVPQLMTDFSMSKRTVYRRLSTHRLSPTP